MSILHNLARRWAAAKLIRDNDQLRRNLISAEAAAERLEQERDRLRVKLRLEQCTSESRARVVRKQQNQIERQADLFEAYRAEIAALKTSLSGTCEQLRQAKAEHARAERELAEVTRLHRERRLA